MIVIPHPYLQFPPAPSEWGHLLRFEGTEGGTTFTDEGSEAAAVTRLGSAAVTGAAGAKFGSTGLVCNLDRVTWTKSAWDDMYGTDLTIEAWIYDESLLADQNPVMSDDWTSGSYWAWRVWKAASSNDWNCALTDGSNFHYGTPITANVSGRWVHIGMMRSGNTICMMLDGVMTNTPMIAPYGVRNSSNYVGVGGFGRLTTATSGATNTQFLGKLDNFAWTKTARYAVGTSYTPPGDFTP